MDISYKKIIRKKNFKKLDEPDENPTEVLDVERICHEFEEQVPQIQELLNTDDLTLISNQCISIGKLAQVASHGTVQILLNSSIFVQILNLINSPIINQVVPILEDLSKSPTNLLIPMLQQGFLDSINYMAQTEDNSIIKSVVNICKNVMARSPFYTTLIYSTGIVHNVTQKLMSRNGSDIFEMLGSHLLMLFCEKGTFKDPNLIDSYNEFLINCTNRETYNSQLFGEFCTNGIALDPSQPFLTLFNLCISTENPKYLYLVIYGCCCLLEKDPTINEIFFSDIPIGVRIGDYARIGDYERKSSKDINLLFQICIFTTGIFCSDIDLPYEVINDFFNPILYIFQIDDVDLIAESTNALINIIMTKHEFAETLLEKKYMDLINKYILNGNFKVQTKVTQLLIVIACNYKKEIIELLNIDVLEKILEISQNAKKNISIKILDTLKRMFEVDDKKKLREMFDQLNGDSLLYELMDGEDKELSENAQLLYNAIYLNDE